MISASTEDFAALLTRLCPSGDAWPTEPDSVQQQALTALASTFKRLNDRANALVVDAFPATTVELLPEWETSLGLPDPCTGPLPTIVQRQNAVVAKLIARGGQSIPYFTQVAASLGYQITVTEYAPARADLLTADAPVADPSWAHTWLINAPQITTGYFSADVSYADEPLEWWGNTQLVCTLSRIKPAHLIALYQFGDDDAVNPTIPVQKSTADTTMTTADSSLLTSDAG